jgi:hypothetical protein
VRGCGESRKSLEARRGGTERPGWWALIWALKMSLKMKAGVRGREDSSHSLLNFEELSSRRGEGCKEWDDMARVERTPGKAAGTI